MSSEPSEPSGHDRNLEEIFASCVERLNSGEDIDPEKILSENPVFGADIIEYLEEYVDFTASLHDPNKPLGTLGDYTLRRQIGRGGMGVVYEAWENSLDRRVALKVLPPGVAADARSSTRFLREAQIVARLSHPQIVPVHSTGIKDGTPWYAMEYIDGETLAQILARIKNAEPETKTPFGAKDEVAYFGHLAKAFADVADGLQHAHSKSVVHRDVKPSNLILDSEGRLRVLDFGLARLEGQDSLTISGDVVGTPLYMSPEQARRKKIDVDHRTDIYSLGATMYEALTGRPPFRGKDHADTLSQIIERDPVLPSRINLRVPKNFETIVLKCLRKDAGDRYGTAEALAQDLRRFARGDAVEAKAEGRLTKFDRWVKRYKMNLSIVACLLVSILVGLVVSVGSISHAYETASEERDAAKGELYRVDMRLAQPDWEVGYYSRLVETLDDHVPEKSEADQRAWEWYHLKSLTRSDGHSVLDVDPLGVLAVEWSPGGARLASGGGGGLVCVWDSHSGELIRELFGDSSPVRALSWSRDGTRLAAVSQSGAVWSWDPRAGVAIFAVRPETELPQGRAQRSILWSPDGAFFSPGWLLEGLKRATGAAVRFSRDCREVLAIGTCTWRRGQKLTVFLVRWSTLVVLSIRLPRKPGDTSATMVSS